MNGLRPQRQSRSCLIPGLLLAGAMTSLGAADVDVSKLPPPATVQVDFVRDIKPILDASCLRCHGPEKPKSGFRLDYRAAALKGGDNGVDILPGQSAKSPLIHYVAQLVEDMEMPPKGKGDALTRDQVGLLRAWIDQGVAWDNAAPTNQWDVSIAPAAGWTLVKGDEHKFREHYWRREGWDGGLERFDLFEQSDPNTKVSASGHAFRDDYRLILDVDRSELGFIHTGWEQYRKYYDDTGGYEPSAPPQPARRLGQDLHLDIGKAWIDFGLTLPHWPRLVLGYEYDYRRGEEATTSWGSNFAPGDPRNLAPTSKHLDESVHVIKFDLDAEVKGVTVEDRFRGEFYDLNTHYTNVAARASVSQDAREHNHYFQGANSIRLEKQFKEWLFTSGGYFYSKLKANDSFTDATVNNAILYLASVPRVEQTRESHLVNANALVGPFDGLTISAGGQSEWTRQHSVGQGNLNGIGFTRPPTLNLAINPATLASDYDQNTVSESAGLRYAKIPFTTLFADGRLQQETIGQSDSDLQPGTSFLENPSFTRRLSDVRGGLHTSPWQTFSFSAHYRRFEDTSRYKTNQVQPAGGYPGFIQWRDLLTHEVEAKLILRPSSWLKTTLSYQFLTTDYKQDTRPAFDVAPPTTYSPGGRLLAGQFDSHIYSLGATLTPFRRVSLSGTFSYQDTVTTTASAGLIPPYRGGVYSGLASATYFLNQKTDMTLDYGLSLADYSQDNPSTNPGTPPPLGIRYQQHAVRTALSRRISKNFSTRLQYGFYYYDEPTLAGANNYKAHTIFATLNYRLP